MSDYFGPKQTRVLDSTNRNFEEVIYQKKKPPLSCEVNLTGKLVTDKIQDIMRYIGPSGWSTVGQLKDSAVESTCCAGDINCSSSYAANSFKLIALEQGVETQGLKALVNGWEIVVQGTNSLSDENNIITLPAPPTIGYRIDFVFLEVWRKLISTTDTIYKHGNLLYGGQNYQNDLIDPAINIETSLRVQIQYRIRVAETDLESYPDGFDPNLVFVQGPLAYPNDTCSHAYFSPVPGDIGLWRAGVGDTAAQEDLETVDGYTYAIPLFAVHRRNTEAYNVDNRSNGSAFSLTNYLNGYSSDRPDNLYNNWVVSTDILDMRHRISPTENSVEITNDGFKKLIRGKIHGVMAKQTIGEDHFGTVLVQTDAISNVDNPGSNRLAEGDSIRRAYANATIEQKETIIVRTVNDKIVGTVGGAWTTGDKVRITIPATYPIGSLINSVQEVYTVNGTLIPTTNYTLSTLPTSQLDLTIGASSPGGLSNLYIECTLQLAAGPNGFTSLPEQMLEFRREDATRSYALTDADIRVRMLPPVITTDGTRFNVLSNRGGNKKDFYDFGHQMTYHALGEGTTDIHIDRKIGGTGGYDILGVISAKVYGELTYRSITGVTRTSTQYTISLGSTAVTIGKDVELQLYTNGKFFETNKQGRGIIDTYEMAEFTPTGSGTTYTVDTTSKAILAMASTWSDASGRGIAYVNGTQTSMTSSNYAFFTDHTSMKSIATFIFSSTPAGAVVEIPLLTKSAITATEGFTFFYDTVPYQGILDSTVIGAIEAEGMALTTTAGSGAITDYTYSIGKVLFNDTSVVQGIGTEWSSNVKAGYTIHNDGTPQKEYVISQVYTDNYLFLTAIPDMSSLPIGENYTITAQDQPSFVVHNIIDRLPILDSNSDASGKSELISTLISEATPVLNTRVTSDVQGIAELPPNVVTIGANVADRGRSTIQIPEEYAPLGVNGLGLKFEKLDATGDYQKSYQSYLLNKENSGELYLMVVGSETDNTGNLMHLNERSENDTVDIFQLPGRPLTNRRHG